MAKLRLSVKEENVNTLNASQPKPLLTCIITIMIMFYGMWGKQCCKHKPGGFDPCYNDFVCVIFCSSGGSGLGMHRVVKWKLPTNRCIWSGVGVTKPISSVPLFSEFFSIIKTYVTYWISRLYLTGVAAAQLRWHLSNVNVIRII